MLRVLHQAEARVWQVKEADEVYMLSCVCVCVFERERERESTLQQCVCPNEVREFNYI